MRSSNKYHNKDRDLLDLTSELFERTNIPFKKSKEEAWEEISGKLQVNKTTARPTRRLVITNPRIALAATLALLIAVGSFARLYRVTTVSHQGENITVELPDGSLAELNENTSLSVHPLWWPVSRKVNQDGEVFFKVKKGKRFTVHTSLGSTEVLGTTFTVFAREKKFRVTCHSGRVRVKKNASEQTVTLSMNESVDLTSRGEFEISEVRVYPLSPEWESKILMFTSAPLRQVLDEIEVQYGIVIETPENLNLIYTGNFKLNQSVEKILSLICRPFNLSYEKRSESDFQIIPYKED